MPGLFYHFLCLMRTWGLDVTAPPMFGIYPTTLSPALLTETAPQLVAALSLYLLSYEFVYYWCAPPMTAEQSAELHGRALHHCCTAELHAPDALLCTPLCTLSLRPRCTLSAPSPHSRCIFAAPSLQVAPRDAREPYALQVGPQAPPPADLP